MKKVLIVLIIFSFSLVLRFLTLNQMGRTWDEHALIERGYIDLQLAKKGNFSDPYWYKYPDHPPLANYLYGLASPLDLKGYTLKPVFQAYPYNKGQPIFRYDWTYTRLVSVFFSSLTVITVVLFGWRYLSPFVGVAAGVILATLPYFLGLSQLITYETFTAFFFTAGVFAFFEFLCSKRLRFLILAGILSGLVLEVKQSNILIFPLVVGLYTLRFAKSKKKPTLREILLHCSLFGLLSIITYIAVWPMPWFHLSQFLSYTHNAWLTMSQSNVELFFGKVHHVPIAYYLINLLVTIPIGVLVLLFFGIKNVFKEKTWLLVSIFLWFAFPFVQSFYPLRQSGLRYIIEIYPPLCLLAGVGLDQVKNHRKKLIVSVVLLVYLLITLSKISPYYLDYFNELVGGTGTVYKYHLFDLGWWGEGEKAAASYIRKHARQGSTIGLALDPVHTMETFPRFEFLPYDKTKTYDYVIVNYFATIRGGIDETPIKKNYTLIFTVFADKAELIHIYKKK